MVARHVAEPRQLGGAAPLLPALDHYHRTDEVQPRRGADKQHGHEGEGNCASFTITMMALKHAMPPATLLAIRQPF